MVVRAARSLLRQAQKPRVGGAAREELLALIEPLVVHFARRCGRIHGMEVEDVRQVLRITALEVVERWTPGRNFEGILCGAFHYKVLDLYKAAKKHPVMPMPEDDEGQAALRPNERLAQAEGLVFDYWCLDCGKRPTDRARKVKHVIDYAKGNLPAAGKTSVLCNTCLQAGLRNGVCEDHGCVYRKSLANGKTAPRRCSRGCVA